MKNGMSIKDYQSDVKYLLDRFELGNDDRIVFLNTYLKVRGHTNDELLLLISLVEEEISQRALNRYLAWEMRVPEDYDINDQENKVPQKNDYELATLLIDRLDKPLYPFKPINPRYLVQPEQYKLFEIAETYMIRRLYLNQDGSWNDNNNLKTLITFLNLLRKVGILEYSNQKDMDSYFAKRYKLDSLGDQMKLNKFKSCDKFEIFRLMLVDMGINLDHYQKG